MSTWLEALTPGLHDVGLNAIGVADGAAYGDWFPGCRHVVVVGSGGPSLWESMLRAVQREPALWQQDHPLDTFVQHQVRALDTGPGPRRRWVFCGALSTEQPDFRKLGHEAGLGWKSRLGLLLHPTFGPWLGLRAACFVDEAVGLSPALGESPCDECPAPCVPACPADALRPEFSISACATYQPGCASGCSARMACPQGSAHAYPPVEHAYHQDRRRGRPDVAALLGVDGDDLGVGPEWNRFST